MSFTGQNPRFRSTILTDIGVASIANPASGSHRIINRGGTLQVQDDTGLETAIGAGGTVDKVTQTAHGFTEGEILYYTGSAYARALANAANTSEIVGMVSRVIDVDTFEVTLEGKVTGLSGLTAGEAYFLSPTVSGAITATEPTVLGHVSLPIGVAISTTVIYVRSSRGAVVGSSNARTEIALGNNAVTNVQSVAAYQAGELTGWVEIDGTTDLKFYVAAPFAKNGAATDYNISPQYVGDTPPVGFSMSVTSGGIIQATLPSIAGYVSAKINFALNAPAVGATFPLSIDSTSVQYSILKAKDSSGFIFQENGGTQIGSISDNGAFVFGQSSFTSNSFHSFQGTCGIALSFGSGATGIGANTFFDSVRNYNRTSSTTNGAAIIFDANVSGSSTAITIVANQAGDTTATAADTVGSMTANGAWTFGASGGNESHSYNGASVTLTRDSVPNGSTTWFLAQGSNSGNSRSGAIGMYMHAGLTYPTGLIRLSIGNVSSDDPRYLWVASTGNFHISGTASDVGTTSGTIVGTQSSDERLKDCIMPTKYGLDTILKLKPIDFVMHGKDMVGFSAQKTKEFIPEAVYDTNESMGDGEPKKLAMDYVQIIPVLTKAIQELSAKVTALESLLN